MKQNPNRWFVGRDKTITGLLFITFALLAIDVLVLLFRVRTSFTFNAVLLLALLLSVHFVLVVLVIRTVRASAESIAEKEENFRRVFHASPVAIMITSLDDGRLISANPAYWKLTGADPAATVGRTTLDLGIWHSETDRAKFITKLTQERSLTNPAYEFKHADGGARVTVAFYELVRWQNQPAVLSMFYDVTEQRRAQLALQASEERYRNFVEQSIEGIWLLGFDQPIPLDLSPEEQVERIYRYGYIRECNDAMAHMYGYPSSAAFRGVRLLNVEAGETWNDVNFQAMLKLVKDGYRSGNRETIEKTRTGEVVYFLNNAVGVIENNQLIGLWGTQRDITAIKKADEALRRSEARTRGLLNAIPDMIFELNQDGMILQFIPSGINEPLFPPEQFLNQRIADVLPDVAEQTAFAIERALESGLVNAFEYELHQNGERRVFEARISASGPDTVLAIVRDVSLRKWAEKERDTLIEELESKNAELERFAYTVSHDLKSPLITIRGFLGFLREDSHSGNIARLDADIQRITAATDKMQTLLDDLLELSRVGRLINKPEYVPFNQIIEEAVELVHGRISHGRVSMSIASDLPAVYGDRIRLVEVMQNLIDNAAKFMGDQPAPRIEIGQNGFIHDMALFYIRDNGIGIPPEFMDNIFGLFNKLDARTEGTGVGLALVKRIIEFHHGFIWAESAPGTGTTFYFTLPTSADRWTQK